eukprot:3215023-Pleurochrysis_carterae.AAC.4
MERVARSATPLSWCTCGGQVVLCTPNSARNSVNSRDRNSPALSLCSNPTTRWGLGERLLRSEVLVSRELRAKKRAGDGGVNEATRVGGLVEGRVMRVVRGVSFGAGGAAVETSLSERRWRVRRDGR